MRITIDNKTYNIKEELTILEACKSVKIEVPSLCYHSDLIPEGRCGICAVLVNGKFMTSCNNKIKDGMNITTTSYEILEYRKSIIQLIACNFEKEE